MEKYSTLCTYVCNTSTLKFSNPSKSTATLPAADTTTHVTTKTTSPASPFHLQHLLTATKMVQFHEHIITDLLEDPQGGLVIISAGLCLHKLIASLLHLHHPSQGSLLILSSSPSQKTSIIRSYEATLSPSQSSQSPPSEITSDLPAHQRLSLYSSGGIFFITTRILIVDLLTHRLPTSSVEGIILLNAHSLSDTSSEAFIVRILRSSNRALFVRAFSDRPDAMVSGFAKAERTLKCLFLRKLHLWPRFQVFKPKLWTKSLFLLFFPYS